MIVCENSPDYPVLYANASAHILLDPRFSVEKRTPNFDSFRGLAQLLRFCTPGVLENMLRMLEASGSVEDYSTSLNNFEQQPVRVSIFANTADVAGKACIVFYLYELDKRDSWTGIHGGVMQRVFQTACDTPDTDEAINRILLIAGDDLSVSRSYIFEEIAPDMTCNTYEWCNWGVEPAIQQLQNLSKAEYQYDEIVRAGVFVCDDIRDLSEGEFQVLNAQGIKSLAIIPMYHLDAPIGYVGFDDCVSHREWNATEIELLESISNVLTFLLVRRNVERKAMRSLEVLQIISDNMDTVIYVNTLDTLELIFINKALADSLGMTPEELIGKPCWQVLQSGKSGQCEWCPIKKMVDPRGNVNSNTYNWEFQNTITGKWYLAKDSVIMWTNGRYVHIETATEITYQKQYEKQLEHYASTDSLTGIFNREWGYKHMEQLISMPIYGRVPLSLCFIDLDGLKAANDSFGHEAGDDMIISTVGAISAATRKSDMMFRWGGDEFILLLQCGLKTAYKVVQGIQKKLDEINRTGAKPFKLSFSYGISDFNNPEAKSVDDIVNDADRKMYINKMEKYRKKLQ